MSRWATSELEQHLEGLCVGGGGVGLESGDSTGEQAHRLVVRVDAAGRCSCRDSRPPGLRGVLRTGREPVAGHFALPIGLTGQHLGHPRVPSRAPTLREGGVRRVADQRVGEAESVDAELAHQSGLQRRVEMVEHPVFVGLQHRRERRHVEVAPDHARHLQRVVRLAGQPAQAAGQHVLHGSRRVLLLEQRGQVATLASQSGVLHQEERVAVGAPAQVVGLDGRRCRGGDGRDDLARLRGREAGEVQSQRMAPGEHLGHHGELPGRRRLVTPGRDHHQPPRLSGLGEQPQHPQGRGVGPVQVVDHHEQVLLGGRVEHRARDRLPGAELRGAVAVTADAGPRAGRGRARAARSPRGTAVARPRPGSSGRPGRWLPRRSAVAASSAHSRLLPMPGSPVTTANTGCSSDCSSSPTRAESWSSRPTSGEANWWPARRRALRGIDGARVHSSDGSWRSTAVCSERSSAARFEAQLVGEQLAHLAQHLEGVGLPPRARQGQGAQAPEPLAQRVGRRQHLQLAGHHRVPAEPERGDGTVLERHRPQLLEPGPFGLRGGCVLELGVGQPAPQREPLVERANSSSSSAAARSRPSCRRRDAGGPSPTRPRTARRRERRRAGSARSRSAG